MNSCEVKFLLCFIFVIVLAVSTITGICFLISPKVEVFVDKKLIYKGSSLCVDIYSAGFTTTVKTSKFFCIVPDMFFTSKDVVVNTIQ